MYSSLKTDSNFYFTIVPDFSAASASVALHCDVNIVMSCQQDQFCQFDAPARPAGCSGRVIIIYQYYQYYIACNTCTVLNALFNKKHFRRLIPRLIFFQSPRIITLKQATSSPQRRLTRCQSLLKHHQRVTQYFRTLRHGLGLAKKNQDLYDI